MHIKPPSAEGPSSNRVALRLVLRQAKSLHKAARSESLAGSLPILRRILATKVLGDISLPQLSHQRDMVQRKHLLRTLAVEAGYSSWEEYRAVLAMLSPEQLEHFDILRHGMGYPNLWFSSLAEAQQHASKYGGRPVRVGRQAVVFADAMSATSTDTPGSPAM